MSIERKKSRVNYRLYLAGQTTAQRAKNILMSQSPPTFTEIKRTTENGGCNWGIRVTTDNINRVVNSLASYGITPRAVSPD
jgi:hypothetical protein